MKRKKEFVESNEKNLEILKKIRKAELNTEGIIERQIKDENRM